MMYSVTIFLFYFIFRGSRRPFIFQAFIGSILIENFQEIVKVDLLYEAPPNFHYLYAKNSINLLLQTN